MRRLSKGENPVLNGAISFLVKYIMEMKEGEIIEIHKTGKQILIVDPKKMIVIEPKLTVLT